MSQFELVVNLDGSVDKLVPVNGERGVYTCVPIAVDVTPSDYEWEAGLPCVLLDNTGRM